MADDGRRRTDSKDIPPSPHPGKNWEGAMLGLALLLRVVNLAGRPLWYDEAFAVLYAEKSLGTMLYGTVTQVEGAAADVHPLFYYTLLHGWMRLWGQSPAAVRSLSVLLGVATVWMVYHLGRHLYGRRVGLVAAILLSISPFHVYYSQETRMYALLGLAVVTTAYCLARGWGPGVRGQGLGVGGRWWIAFAISGAITLYAHNLGAFFLAALDAWVVWAWWRGRRLAHWRPIVLSHLLMLVLFAPWLLVVPEQLGKIGQAYWVTRPGLPELIQTLLIFHFAYDNQALPTWLLPAALFFSLLIPAVLLVASGRRQAASGKSDGLLATCHLLPATCHSFLLCLAVLPILLTFLVSQVRPVYVVRAMLPSAVMYDVLAAAVLVKGSMPRLVRWGVWLPAAAMVIISLVNHYTYARFPRPPFDQVAAYLAAQSGPADAIVHSNKLTFLPTYYYDRQSETRFLADAPGSPEDTLAYPTQVALGLFAAPDLATATQGRQRVWFILLERGLEEYQAAGRPHPHLAWLEERYKRVGTAVFNDVLVYEYVIASANTSGTIVKSNTNDIQGYLAVTDEILPDEGDDDEIPNIVIGRLPVYLQALSFLAEEEGKLNTSSHELGQQLGISSAQIRKDLSHFGEFGKQGTGYHVGYLIEQLRRILHLDQEWPVALIGAGYLGHALAHYGGFGRRGFSIVGIFDNDPAKVGQEVNGLPVQHLDCLQDEVRQRQIKVAILAVPAVAAQDITDLLVGAGVRAILSYAPIHLNVPADVQVRYSDPVVQLQQMTYYLEP